MPRAVGIVVGWGIIWLLVTLGAVLLVSHRRSSLPAHGIFLVFAGIAAAAVFTSWFTSFPMGNSVSDLLPPYRGGQSVATDWLYFAGPMLLIGVVVGILSPRTRASASSANNA